MSFAFEKTARISFSCKLVTVQYREYENGLFVYHNQRAPERAAFDILSGLILVSSNLS